MTVEGMRLWRGVTVEGGDCGGGDCGGGRLWRLMAVGGGGDCGGG